MQSLVDLLYIISTSLMAPVILVLLGFVIWALIELGSFVREIRDRRKGRVVFERFVTELQQPGAPLAQAAAFFELSLPAGFLASFVRRGRPVHGNAVHLGKLVSQIEIEASGRLSSMTMGTRVGPMLGLMGTLIPMGPALVGLSTGAIDVLAANLVVAFSTTVLGLFVGAICFGMSVFRRRWYAADLSNIEYVYDCLHSEMPGSEGAA